MMDFLFSKTPLLFFVQSFWRDEAFSYILAKRSLTEIAYLTAKDFNPPFYYYVLHYWMKIFGGSEIALRSLSLLFFCGSIYLVDHILIEVLKISSITKRVIYLILFAINPILLYFAFEARMYSMFVFFAMLSFYGFYTKRNTLYIMSVFYGLFTHYFMVFVIISQFAFLLVSRNRKRVALYLNMLKAPFFVFGVWLLYVIKNGSVSSSFWIPLSNLRNIIYIPAILYTGYEKSNVYDVGSVPMFTNLLLSITCLFVLLITLYVFKTRKRDIFKDKNLWEFFILWGLFTPVLIFFISFIKPLFLPRYLIYSVPGLIFLLIYLIEHIRPLWRYIVLGLLFIVTISFQKNYLKFHEKKYPAHTIFQIKNQLQSNEVVYVTNELDFFVAQYYLGEDRVFVYSKDYEEIPQYVGKVLIPPEKIKNLVPFYPRRAIILHDDGSVTVDSIT